MTWEKRLASMEIKMVALECMLGSRITRYLKLDMATEVGIMIDRLRALKDQPSDKVEGGAENKHATFIEADVEKEKNPRDLNP